MHCREDIQRSKFCTILLLALFTLNKEINIRLAIVMASEMLEAPTGRLPGKARWPR